MPPTPGGFENLKVWQYSRQLCRDVYPVACVCASKRDFPLSQQLNRASLSIVANIAEGYLRRTHRELAPFIRIAAGSNAEVRALLYAAVDRDHLTSAAAAPLLDRSNEIGRMLQGLLASIHRNVESRPRA
jgi:four helix bundle protein